MKWNRYGSYVALLGLLTLQASSMAYCNEFVLDVNAPSQPTPISGPIPLKLVVRYVGATPIKVAPLWEPYLDVAVQGPMSWQKKKTSKNPLIAMGMSQVTELVSGAAVSNNIYLNDFFSQMEPGSAVVQVILNVWPSLGGVGKIVELKSETRLNLTKNDNGELKACILSISGETNADKRFEIYRSLRGVESSQLVPVFLDVLLDNEMADFHEIARKRIVELHTPGSNWKPVIDYLKRSGCRSDASLFEYWKKARVQLTETEVDALANASNPWIRLFNLQYGLGNQQNILSVLGSLETEMNDFKANIFDFRVKHGLSCPVNESE